MRVLMITGDRNMLTRGTEAYARAELQRSQVEKLTIVYWGRGALWPKVVGGGFDVVTAQDPFWRGLVGWFLARRMGARLNIQVHTDLSAQSFIRHVLAQIVLRHADSVRVVSGKIKSQVESIGIKVPVRVLSVFVDVGRFKNIVRKPHDKKTILWLGRFEDEKDPMRAISVLRKIKELEAGVKLIMLGRGSMEKKLREQAQGLPVEFPGWQDPTPYLAIADVVLCTSKHESYGVSIVEALTAGVSVVAPDVGIAKEAGATVVSRGRLAEEVVEVLQTGVRGELRLSLPNAQEWAMQWQKTL